MNSANFSGSSVVLTARTMSRSALAFDAAAQGALNGAKPRGEVGSDRGERDRRSRAQLRSAFSERVERYNVASERVRA